MPNPEPSILIVENSVAQGAVYRAFLRNVLDRLAMSDLVSRLKEDFQRRGYHGFIGASLPMQAIYRIIDAAAPSRATVFITDESGTGKEVCADAVHRQSDRRNAPSLLSTVPRSRAI